MPSLPTTTEGLLEDLSADGGQPEARARFTDRCISGGCAFWGDGRCRAIEAAHTTLDPVVDGTAVDLPDCGIRPACRWWQQEGENACRVCPYVSTAVTIGDVTANHTV